MSEKSETKSEKVETLEKMCSMNHMKHQVPGMKFENVEQKVK